MEDIPQQYLEPLFDLANAITGFSVAQMLAFLYALQKVEKLVFHVRESWGKVFIAIALSGVIYSVLVVLCFFGEKNLLESLDAWELQKTFSFGTMFGRVGIILAMTALGLYVLILDRNNQKKQSRQNETSSGSQDGQASS